MCKDIQRQEQRGKTIARNPVLLHQVVRSRVLVFRSSRKEVFVEPHKCGNYFQKWENVEELQNYIKKQSSIGWNFLIFEKQWN